VVQPFDYSIRSTAQGPLQALSQGMQLGQQFAQIAEQREAQRLAQEKARVQAEQQLLMDAALKNLNAKRSAGTATYDDFQNVVLANPGMKSLAENMTGLFNQFSTERQNNEKSYFGKVIASLQVDPSVAVQLLNQRADATAESNPNESMVMRTYARLANENPGRVADTLIAMNSGPFGKDWTESVLKVRQAMVMGPTELREASAKADKAIADAKIAQAQAGTAEAREVASRDLAVAQARKAQIEAQVAETEQKAGGGIGLTNDMRTAIGWSKMNDQQREALKTVMTLGRPVTNISVSNIESTGQKELAAEGKNYFTQMNAASTFLGDMQRYRDSLQKAFTGPLANEALVASRIFGFAPEQQAATRQVIQGLAKSVLNARSLLEGQGAISNFEQEMLNKAEGGEINWSRQELSALFDVAERAARLQYQQGQRFLDNAIEAYPDAASLKVFRRSAKPMPAPSTRPRNAPPSVVEPPTTGAAAATPVPAGNVATPVTTSPAARPPIQVPPLPPTRDYGAGTRVAPASPGGKDIGGGFRVLD